MSNSSVTAAEVHLSNVQLIINQRMFSKTRKTTLVLTLLVLSANKSRFTAEADVVSLKPKHWTILLQ